MSFADSAGAVYVLESDHPRVRRIAPNGIITTYAGNGVRAFSADGQATQASFVDPDGLAIDSQGNLYIADTVASRIRKVSRTGVISTVAGRNANQGFAGDGGPATSALLYYPGKVAVDGQGSIFIADTFNNRIRKVSPNGIITTIAGTGQLGFSGDRGPATSATLNRPHGIAVDDAGYIYVSDRGNRRVRRIDPQGIITTIAGTGAPNDGSFNGFGVTLALVDPKGLTLDKAGNLYIADALANVVYRLDPAGRVTIAAGGSSFRSAGVGDGGPATQAFVGDPEGVAIDGAGRLLIASGFSYRVRAVLPNPPSFTASAEVLAFSARVGAPPPTSKTVTLSSSVPGVAFAITSGAPWLSATPAAGSMPTNILVSVDPSTLAPGDYTATVSITAAAASPPVLTITVNLSVDASLPPALAVRPDALSFALSVQSPSSSQILTVSNSGGGSLDFSAAGATSSGGAWLSVSPASGTVQAAAPVSLTVTVNPTELGPGAYTGRITISGTSGQSASVTVTMTVSAIVQTILLSQTGLTFTAVVQGGTVPPQSVAVLNTGQASMVWTASPSTLSGGVSWLSVTPDSGASNPDFPPPAVVVRVNHAGLASGEYYGLVSISAPGANNTPQIVSVVLNVLPAGSQPGAVVQPSGLIFTGAAGSSPGSQTVTITNISAAPSSYASGRLTLDGGAWFTHLPQDATAAPSAPLRVVVQPNLQGLSPGIRRGALTFLFTDGSIRTVSLFLVVSPSGSASSAKSPALAQGCSPSRLVPVFTSLGDNFNLVAAWPTTIEARVVDDCGSPVLNGSVVASFSNGDPVLKLTGLGEGRWTGTWQPRATGQASVSISLTALTNDPVLRGSIQAIGGLRANVHTPSIDPGSVVSSASLARQLPLAPGALVSIFGSQLSDGTSSSQSIPWDTSLLGTGVLMAGQLLPLAATSDGQIDAVLRYDVPVNTQLQLLVLRGGSAAQPETVTVAAAQPSIFTTDRTGKGQGSIFVVSPDGVETLADSSAGAKAGDTIVIHCSGLGAVDPPLPAGSSAPASPVYSTLNPAKLTIGGVDAQVAFAGLLPDHVGWYQVRAVVPPGVARGSSVPVVLTVAGQASPPVTIAVQE